MSSGILKKAKILGEVIARRDSWINAVTGLGSASRDKSVSAEFYKDTPLTDEQLEALYHGDPFAAKIVDKLPLEAFRQGWDLATSDELEPEEKSRQESLLLDTLDSIGAVKKAPEAAIWGRLFGGGILFVGVDEGEVDEPIVEESVKGIRFLKVLDKRDLQKNTVYEDPKEDKFGEVETYRFTPVSHGTQTANLESGTIIHESRLIVFPGVLTSEREKQYLQGWDHSVLHRVHTTLRASSSDWGSVSTMLSDASQGILKIKDFYEVISGGAKDTFEERLAIVDLARFVGRVMPIDVEEDFTYQERSFAGVADLLDKLMLRLAAAADMPVTVLMGQSPAGMNATGESDLTIWFNTVSNERDNKYTPLMDRLIYLAALATDGITAPDTWSITWPSLWQMTPTEEADHKKKTAETDKIYIDGGVLEPEEVTAERFGGEEYSDGPPMVDLEGREIEEVKEPEPAPFANPFAADNPFMSQEEGEEKVDSWNLPEALNSDLMAMEKLSYINAPKSLLNKLGQRVMDGLGFHSGEVYEAIEKANFQWLGGMSKSRRDSFSTTVPPAFLMDLEAAVRLTKLDAPQLVLRRLVKRVASNLSILDQQIEADIDDTNFEIER